MARQPFDPDILRKDLHFNCQIGDEALNFYSTWGLFSPKQIDDGTTLLLKYVEVNQDAKILDLGCGYGPIGIYLAKKAPKGEVIMVDKDFVAVDYANKNAKANAVPHCQAMLSNGFNQVPDMKFDCIISNIPAKVGNEMLYLYLYDAKARLNPGGVFYVVTINGLRQFMKRAFQDVFGNYKKHKQGSHYTVASATQANG